MKKNILLIFAVFTCSLLSTFSLTTKNGKTTSENRVLSNIQALATEENTMSHGCHVLNGRCTVTVNGRKYSGSWNECEADINCPSCRNLCSTDVQI